MCCNSIIIIRRIILFIVMRMMMMLILIIIWLTLCINIYDDCNNHNNRNIDSVDRILMMILGDGTLSQIPHIPSM